ncbi:MAG: AAA family ATPase, partial [Flavobacteriales bacterium]|nr:AAA family ATPase [Flavobacteriales bacterium]
MKLLNKNAEDRYSSAWGLKDDLEECLDQLNKTGSVERFTLGSKDYFSQFKVPEKLYGREMELKELMEAFDRVSAGSTEMMLVAGYSGVGKSALINEVQKPITEKRGHFISGKFDQYQRVVPYYAIVRSFKEFVNQLLTEDEDYLNRWQGIIQQAVGAVGKVLTDVIPNLELILGHQPEVPELGGIESQNRFTYVFRNLMKSIATANHPLVLFIDDLQWADSASLNLIKSIMTDKEIQYVLFIGAYRDNEVTPSHPSMLTVKEIEDEGGIIHRIALPNLSLENINQLTSDALATDMVTSMPLSELVYEKTHGNPFFVNQFLKSLYENGLLTFDQELQGWQWDVDEIRSLKITDNVVELMAGRVQNLAKQTQEILKLAACIGNRFNLSTLTIIHKSPEEEAAQQLWPAIEEGLIVPVGNQYKLIGAQLSDGRKPDAEYQFAHDRIQQAVYSLIAEEDTQSVHLKTGRLLIANIDKSDREEHLFDIVNHLNKGKILIESAEEKVRIASLNLEAGTKARLSVAFEPALNYFQAGIDLLDGISWEHHYELMLSLYSQAAEASYLNGDYEQTDEKVDVVLQNARTVLDKITVYETKILSYTTQGKFLAAINAALSVLKQLGIRLPKKPNKFHIVIAILRVKFLVGLKGFENLADLPAMTDPHKMAAMRILSRIFSASYMGIPELVPLISLEMIRLSIRYGNHDVTALGYASYGLILTGVLKQIESGYKYGQLSLAMLEKLNAKGVKTRAFFIIHSFINPWKIHIKKSIAHFQEAYRSGLETGDIEFGVYCISMSPFFSFYTNAKLPDLIQEVTSNSRVILQLKQKAAVHRVNILHQVILNLTGESNHTYKLKGEAYDEERMLPIHIEQGDKTTAFIAYYDKVYLCYHFGKYEEALKSSELAHKYKKGAIGTIYILLLNVYESLSHLALYRTKTKAEKGAILKIIKANQKNMKKWAHHAPMNYLHKFHLVEAERCRVLGKTEKAGKHYEQAIALANKHGYINEEALGYELAAKFYIGLEQIQLGRYYLQDALDCYTEWGAQAKVDDLKTRYREYIKTTVRPSTKISGGIVSEGPVGQDRGESLDLSSILK